MQSRSHSLIESFANVIVGYLVACFSQMAIFPMFGIHIPIQDNFIIGLWFTAISIARSYTVRRIFTSKTERGDDYLETITRMVPPDVLRALADGLNVGDKKHGNWNVSRGRTYEAIHLEDHLDKLIDGYTVDSDDGHLNAIAVAIRALKIATLDLRDGDAGSNESGSSIGHARTVARQGGGQVCASGD